MIAAAILWTLLTIASGAAAGTAPLWSDVRDGGGLADDRVDAVAVAPDHHLIAAGVVRGDDAGADVIVRKLRHDDGAEVWSRRISSFDSNDMAVGGIACDAAGDVIVGGHVLGCVG